MRHGGWSWGGSPEVEGGIERPERRPLPVRGEHPGRPVAARPGNAQRRVVPQQATRVVAVVVVGQSKSDLGVGLERAEAVRETGRYMQLTPVAGGEFHDCVFS